jgi:hypothetical protein
LCEALGAAARQQQAMVGRADSSGAGGGGEKGALEAGGLAAAWCSAVWSVPRAVAGCRVPAACLQAAACWPGPGRCGEAASFTLPRIYAMEWHGMMALQTA